MNASQKRRSPAATGLRDRTHKTSKPNSTTGTDPAQHLLNRLEGVIATGKGWRSRCPAHNGKSRSLAIAQGDNGTLLVHCFAGCAVHDVLASVGLLVGDLFAHRDLHNMSPAERRQLRQAALLPRWRAAVDVLTHEASVVQAAASKLGDGMPLNEPERTRLNVAALRIFDAQDVLARMPT